MNKYYTFVGLWLALDRANQTNDIDYSNKLILWIEELLPFKNKAEHEKWLDLVSTYMDFNEFEEMTFNIALRYLKEKEL